MSITTMVQDAEAAAKKRGLTVAELCRVAGVNRATWQRWKAGKVGPTMKKWQAVEAALQTEAA